MYSFFGEMLAESEKYWGDDECEFFGMYHLGETHQPYWFGDVRRSTRPWMIMHRWRDLARAVYPKRVELPPVGGQARWELVSGVAEALLWQIEALHWVDSLMAPLLELPDCRVVVLADHGENWDPRYNLGHGFSYTLKEDALHVPMLTNIEPLGDLGALTSTKEVFRVCLGEELEQGCAESFFFGHGESSQVRNPCTSDDNRVLVDRDGWHYLRRFDDLTTGSLVPEGHVGFEEWVGEVVARLRLLIGRWGRGSDVRGVS